MNLRCYLLVRKIMNVSTFVLYNQVENFADHDLNS